MFFPIIIKSIIAPAFKAEFFPVPKGRSYSYNNPVLINFYRIIKIVQQMKQEVLIFGMNNILKKHVLRR